MFTQLFFRGCNALQSRFLPGLLLSQSLVEIEGSLRRGVLMDNRTDSLYHGNRVIGLEDVPSHVYAGRPPLDSVVCEFQGLFFGKFLAPRHNEWNGAGSYEFFEALAVIGLHEVGAEFRSNTTAKGQITGVPRHVLADRSHGKNRDAVPMSFVYQLRQIEQRLLFIGRTHIDGQGDSRDAKPHRTLHRYG